MGAQDRPQCHFDIEINREPGEPETGEPCWGKAGLGEGAGLTLSNSSPGLLGSG